MPSPAEDAPMHASLRVARNSDLTRAEVVVDGAVVATLPLLDLQADANAQGDRTLTLKLAMALDMDRSTTEFLAWVAVRR